MTVQTWKRKVSTYALLFVTEDSHERTSIDWHHEMLNVFVLVQGLSSPPLLPRLPQPEVVVLQLLRHLLLRLLRQRQARREEGCARLLKMC